MNNVNKEKLIRRTAISIFLTILMLIINFMNYLYNLNDLNNSTDSVANVIGVVGTIFIPYIIILIAIQVIELLILIVNKMQNKIFNIIGLIIEVIYFIAIQVIDIPLRFVNLCFILNNSAYVREVINIYIPSIINILAYVIIGAWELINIYILILMIRGIISCKKGKKDICKY